MIVAMAGLPATGKTTLARGLASHLDALVLDKDTVRETLFGPAHITYTRSQDDLCVSLVLQAARWALEHALCHLVILDGRTWLRSYQIDQVRRFAREAGSPLHIVECVCAEATARARLLRDTADRSHPAANRDYELYRHLQATAEPIPEPKLVVCTDQPLSDCVGRCLRYLCGTGPSGDTSISSERTAGIARAEQRTSQRSDRT